MNAVLKKYIKVIFYPLVIIRRFYIKKRNNYLAINDPKRLANIYYKNAMGHDICWSHPLDLNEKINWLKFNSDTSLWTRLADKYLVRDYVEQKGLGHILPKLYGVWNNANDIDFTTLPDKFVLKTNHGCGTVIIVKDKSKLEMDKVRIQLNEWLEVRYGLETVEPHYLSIKPLIVAEELLIPSDGKELLDYKLFMANGQPQLILVCSGRKIGVGCKLSLYDTDWNFIPEKLSGSHLQDKVPPIPKPKTLEQMIQAAILLSDSIAQVRVDFYEVDGKLYFGEMTFTSQGGYMGYLNHDELLRIGSIVKLPLE